MEFLEQIKKLQNTPGGKKLTPTQKLAIIYFIFEGGGDPVILDPEAFAAFCLIQNLKSVSRIVCEMRDEGLIVVSPRRDAKGHKAAPEIELAAELLENAKIPNHSQVDRESPNHSQVDKPNHSQVDRVFASKSDNSNGSNNLHPEQVKIPNHSQVDRESPNHSQVDRRKSNSNNDLPEFSNGTEFAISPSPLNVLNKGGREIPNHSQVDRVNDPVEAWKELTGEPEITENAEKLIRKKVFNVPVWRETLEGWIANPKWNNLNIDGQISRYNKKLTEAGLENVPPLSNSQMPPPTNPQESEEELERKRRLKEKMYKQDED